MPRCPYVPIRVQRDPMEEITATVLATEIACLWHIHGPAKFSHGEALKDPPPRQVNADAEYARLGRKYGKASEGGAPVVGTVYGAPHERRVARYIEDLARGAPVGPGSIRLGMDGDDEPPPEDDEPPVYARDEAIAMLEDLGVEVDGRWGDRRIQEVLAKSLVEANAGEDAR